MKLKVTMLFALFSLVCSMVVFAIPPQYSAVNPPSVQLYLDSHPAFKTAAPANTQTSATTVLTYSGQPATGTDLIVSYAGIHETYEFYTGSTYTGPSSYTGVHIEAAMDDTYGNLVTALAASRLTDAVQSTGGNTVTFRSKFRGTNANYIAVDSTAIANITPVAATLLTGGTSASGEKYGEQWYNSTDGVIWIRVGSGQVTDPAWRVLNSPINGSYEFGDTDAADSQSAVEWGTSNGSDVGGSVKRIVMPRSGSVVGISVIGNTACTAGSLVVHPTIDGTATTFGGGLNTHSGSTITSYSTQVYNTDTFTAGQAIGVKATTASWLPVTDDVGVTVFVKFN